MDSKTVLKEAFVIVKCAMRARDYSAKGTTFYHSAEDGNTVVLSLQRSVKSSSARTVPSFSAGHRLVHLGRYRALGGAGCLRTQASRTVSSARAMSAEHPVGQRQQGGAVHLESLGVVGHGDETESAVEV
jgi:hypothetical protein